ncbi:hypothetical protein [Rubinisphaera margarita]|uniref:hypothetical protein n=1 Tax=Rubinisphaera margarita TaxID=2909586 RepID=UPI001EE86ABE|nr:hypothetical protein [Rubinisphaera margarita]MCG6156497.1 hypothetical protein [Rubinisphaera margarita]
MTTRRSFLQTALAAGTLGDLAFLSGLAPVKADDLKPRKEMVHLAPEIEPVVRLIETTPRERLLEVMAERIRGGLSYQEVLAALQLAGVRNVEPRPSVGFKFHTVLVVNSAHLASVAGPPEHRWLPIFWALDYFKSAAARDVRERDDWVMPPIDENAIPAAHKSRSVFTEAMENWDESAADAAVAGLARTAGLNEIYEMLFRIGARDFRSIGHKAIFVANSYRALQAIGHRHAEPILRSLAYALLMHDGGNPRDRDDEADRPYRRNVELAENIRPHWRDGQLDRKATEEFMQALRTDDNNTTCDLVVEQLNAGVSPQSIWDAMLVGSGELLMRQPGIVALHAATTSNALYYAWQTSADDRTQRLMLLQNAAFLPMFRDAMNSRGRVADLTIDSLNDERSEEERSVEQLFQDVGRNSTRAAADTFAYLQQEGSPRTLIDTARLLVFLKGNDAHDYKFSSAVLEDFYHVSPEWRNQYLAASMVKLQSSTAPDNDLVQRTREAFA